MKANAHLIVIEAFLLEVDEDVPPTMLDTQVPLIGLHMLVATGRERSLSEYDGLFIKAGLRRIRTTPLDNGGVRSLEMTSSLPGKSAFHRGSRGITAPTAQTSGSL
jgi:hypothetical protein